MNKSHATIFLCHLMGESDGEWTTEEINTVVSMGHLKSAIEEAPDFAFKMLKEELNETSAIDILNQESKEVQMQCLIAVLATALSDGEFKDAEQAVLARIMSKLNKGITLKEVIEATKAHLESLKKNF